MKKIVTYYSPDVNIVELLDVRQVICSSYNEIVIMQDELDSDALDW